MIDSGNEDAIIAYLLGDLPKEARAALDERLRANASFFEMAMAIEDDLLLEYARGGLGGDLRARVERAYGETPARHARLHAAHTFLRSLPHVNRRGVKWATARTASYSFAAVLATAMVVLLWLPGRKQVTAPRPAVDASFELSPGRTRSGAGKEISLPAAAHNIGFTLRVAPHHKFRVWSATLGTVERPDTWKGAAIPREAALFVAVPVSALRSGDYTLRLFGGDTGTELTEHAIYYFRIE